jgi:hypothetical protein
MRQLTNAEMNKLNAFELAKYKADMKAYKASRAAQPVPVERVEQVAPVAPVVAEPKEKASPDAFIEVNVRLPNKQFQFMLRKKNVLSNMSPGRATEAEFRNAVAAGLSGLMGRVE